MSRGITSVFMAFTVAHAADPNIPHMHEGSLEPFRPGPPPALSSSDLSLLKSGKSVQRTVEVAGGKAGRAMAVFDVAAPPSVVWDCILDLKSYPRMVPGVSAMEIYKGPISSGGATKTYAKWTLSMLGYRLSYYLVTRYDARIGCMTFQLDYSRNSDLDDSVGYWHVAPMVQADGTTHSRVTYMAALALRGWFPKSVIDILFATTLGKATAWVGQEALKRLEAKGGVVAQSVQQKCRWSWKRMRRVCVQPPSPRVHVSQQSSARHMIDMAAKALTAVAILLFCAS